MVDSTGNPYLRDPRFALSPEQMSDYRLSSLGSMLANTTVGSLPVWGKVGSAHCAHPTRTTPMKTTIRWQVRMPGDHYG
jgi:hypothetical protein